MERKRGVFKNKVMEALEIPAELAFSDIVLTLVGQRQITVENFCGIISYTDQCICISTKRGRVVIKGCCLLISCFCKQEMEISGCISAICFEDR